MHAADLVFTYDDFRTAALVADAVAQEVGEIGGDRSRAAVSRTDDEVHVDVTAEDLVALRAGLNTWNTLVEVAERTVETASSGE